MAMKNIASAEENLRCANLGFKEGVMEVTDVMAAQTAWQKAQSQKIDAEIDVKLTQVGLNKALGILQ
jgi:outer membrane protein TolC